MADLNDALAAFNQGDLDRAAALCAAHGGPAAQHLLGIIAFQRSDFAVAESRIREALDAYPDVARWQANLGAVLIAREAWMPAVFALRRALQLDQTLVDAHNNLALAMLKMGYPDSALAAADAALAIRPGFAPAHTNRGAALQRLGRWSAARAAFDAAARAEPDSAEHRYQRGVAALLDGDFARGWADFASRPVARRPNPWRGEPLWGTPLLVYAEGRTADLLHFCRYAPWLAAQGERVIFEAPSRMHRLLQTLQGDIVLVAPGEVRAPRWSCPLLSLPALLTPNIADFPTNTPYLYAERARVERWQSRLPKAAVRVGLCGNADLSVERFTALAQTPGVRFVNLQSDAPAEVLNRAPWLLRLFGVDADAALVDTAAVIMSLDLIITTDTPIAHLAGALGRPTWILLPPVPDWRWMIDRKDSPWYPTMRLFRASGEGDWADVFARLQDALSASGRERF